MCLSVCLLIVFFCLKPSWKIDMSNQWLLEIKSILLLDGEKFMVCPYSDIIHYK